MPVGQEIERGHEEGGCDGMSQFPGGWESLVSPLNIFKVQARVEIEVLLTRLLSLHLHLSLKGPQAFSPLVQALPMLSLNSMPLATS